MGALLGAALTSVTVAGMVVRPIAGRFLQTSSKKRCVDARSLRHAQSLVSVIASRPACLLAIFQSDAAGASLTCTPTPPDRQAAPKITY